MSKLDEIEKRMKIDDLESNIDQQFALVKPESGAALSFHTEWYERNKQFITDLRYLIERCRKLEKVAEAASDIVIEKEWTTDSGARMILVAPFSIDDLRKALKELRDE